MDSGAASRAPITARGVLASCELVMNIGLTGFCAMKKINRRDPEIRNQLTLSQDEREMLLPLAEDAAPAWREIFGQSGPGAVYMLLGVMGLLTVIRVMDLNSKVPKKANDDGESDRPKPSPQSPVPNDAKRIDSLVVRSVPGAPPKPNP